VHVGAVDCGGELVEPVQPFLLRASRTEHASTRRGPGGSRAGCRSPSRPPAVRQAGGCSRAWRQSGQVAAVSGAPTGPLVTPKRRDGRSLPPT
jgi:hypothetical protein